MSDRIPAFSEIEIKAYDEMCEGPLILMGEETFDDVVQGFLDLTDGDAVAALRVLARWVILREGERLEAVLALSADQSGPDIDELKGEVEVHQALARDIDEAAGLLRGGPDAPPSAWA